MLFTDSAISTAADLGAYESDIRDIASITGLDLEVKLRLAQTELGVEIQAASPPRINVPLLPDQSGVPFRLDQLAVTDALKLWHVFHTLAIVYRDAYNRKVNDKYLLKWNEYRALAKWAANLFFNIGAGLVFRPLSAPGMPAVGEVAGGSLPETTYFVRVTWTDAAGAESGPSPVLSYRAPAGHVLRVSAMALAPPAAAVGWYPYLGSVADSEQRQVSEPVALASSWTMAPGGLISGPPIHDGQQPDCFRQIARVSQRG